ncbi:MAG: 3'-5' exonuclease [Anaerococcus obesiensis]
MLSRKYKEETVNKDIYIESLKYFTKSCENLDQVYEKIKIIEKKSKSLSENNLKLSTIHSSKGLEYDTVFVIDLIKNEFPIILDEKIILKDWKKKEEFYVAITRAKIAYIFYH